MVELLGLAQAEREDIRKLAAYPEGSAGSIMTSEYATLPVQISAGEAIAKLRREEAARKISRYDLLALPVVNEQGVAVAATARASHRAVAWEAPKARRFRSSRESRGIRRPCARPVSMQAPVPD
ncbi:MAG: hypothetical protein JXB06_10435 [Spirochaetales bacterium]|nr:hypothetical protein [Spirochaetales bacterium]